MLDWLRLEIFMGFATAIVVITQVIKIAPAEWTSNYPKTIAWVVTAILIGLVGYFEGAKIETVVAIGTAIGFAANGLYDVLADIWRKATGK